MSDTDKMSRPLMAGRSESSMRTKSIYLRNLMAERDRENAKRLAKEKEAEAQRAEEARHLSTPGSWIDEDTITPKQPSYYFPHTPDAPEKNDAVEREALVKETFAKEAERVRRQQASAAIASTRKPGLGMAATGISKNSMPPKMSGIRVNPDGQREPIKKASAFADQRTGKETRTPQVLGKQRDSTRIAKPNAARHRSTIREAENAIQAKLENAHAEYMEGRRRFEIASGGMPFEDMWESDAKFHLLEDRDYYGPLLKKIDAWKDVRDWYSAKLAALKAKYSKPAPLIQGLRKKDSPSIATTQSIAVEKKPAHVKSTRERFEAFRAFELANSQQSSWATRMETKDRPAPRNARASDESKHDNQSMLTSSKAVEDAASQHELPLKQSHATASRYVESAPMEPVQVEEHTLQETEQTTLTPSTQAEGTASQHAFNLEQPYAQAAQYVEPVKQSHTTASRYVESAPMEPVQVKKHALQETEQASLTPSTQAAQYVEPASSEPPQVENTLPLSEQTTLTLTTQAEGTASHRAFNLEQPYARAAQYVEPASSEPPQVENTMPLCEQTTLTAGSELADAASPAPMGEEALPQREQSNITSPEPVMHAPKNVQKSIVPAANVSQELLHKGEGRWSNHKCNMPYCRAHFSFAKNYPYLGVFNGRPSVLGKRSATEMLGIEEPEVDTRRVRDKPNIFGWEIIHVLADGFLSPSTVIQAPRSQEAAGIEYLPAPPNPFESSISAGNSVQTQDISEYRMAMELYEKGLHFGADGLEGKDDDATNGGQGMDIDDGEGTEEGEDVHGYVERFLSDPISHNGVYFIHRQSGPDDMIKIDIPRDSWLRQNDHNEENLDRGHIYVLIQLCEIVRIDNKLGSTMDPNVAGQLADSNLSMLLRAFANFANSYSWLDRWTTRRQVRGLLDELVEFSTAFDRDDHQMMQLFVDDSDGPIVHAVKALRAILAESENDKNPPTSGGAPRRTFTPKNAPLGPWRERRSALKKQGTAARDTKSRTVVDATKATVRDASMIDAITGVPVGAPTGPRADKGKARMRFDATTGVPVRGPSGPRADKGKARMRPESVGHDSAMRDAPNERLGQRQNGAKPGISSKFDQSKKNGVRRSFLAPDETDQDTLDAKTALNLGPRNFSGIGQAPVEPQEMEIEGFDTDGNKSEEMETDVTLGSSTGPPPHAPRGPRGQQNKGPKHRSSNMPPRLNSRDAPSGPSRLRNPDADTRRTSMPPRPTEHAEGRFGNEEQDSRRGRSETRDEQPRRQNPRSKEREERARGQEKGRSSDAFSSDPRRQHGYSGQQQPERPPRPANPNAGLGHQRQSNQTNRKAEHPQQGSTNAHNHQQQPPYQRNGSTASQTQGNVDPYAQARLQNNQNRHNRNRLRSNAMSGGRAQIEDNAPESGHSFLGAARRNRPNSQN